MEVYNQFLLPTTSELAVYCTFRNQNEHNIAVSKGNLLQIFRIVDTNENETNNTLDTPTVESIEPISQKIKLGSDFKLILVSEYQLNGKILNIHKFRAVNSEIDYLLISTETAKISIIKWNESDNLISVVSLHYYETLLDSLLLENLQSCEVLHRSDPNNGCTIMQVHDVMVILPFKTNGFDDDLDANDDYQPAIDLVHEKKPDLEMKTNNDVFYNSFVMNARTLHPDLSNIIDFQFLNSYNNPTVAILYAPKSLSSTGNLSQLKDNLKIIVLSLDLQAKSADIIIEVSNLPYDLEHIVPLDNPINGFLLCGSNEIIHINSMGSAKGIYVNEYYRISSDFELKNQEDLNLFVELSEICQLNETEALLITKEGLFYTLIFEETGGVSNLTKIVKNDESKYKDLNIMSVTQITKVPNQNLFFVCSSSSNAMLIEWEYQTKTGLIEDGGNGADQVYEDDEDFWLYNNTESNKNDEIGTSLLNCQFKIADKLINIGPLTDFTMAPVSTESKIHGLPNPNLDESAIYGSSGTELSGAISMITPTVKPIVKSSLKFSNASKIWTVLGHKRKTKYLITTDIKTSHTQIFEVSKEYKEYKPTDFRGRSFTVQFGSIETDGKIRLAQVLAHKVIIYNLSFGFITTLSFEQEINSSFIFEKYIVLLMKSGEIEILEYDNQTKKLSKMDLPALLNYLIFTNAWVSRSSVLNQATPSRKRNQEGDIIEVEGNNDMDVLFWLVTADNRLLVFKKDHFEKVFEMKNVHKMSEYLQLTPMDPQYEADVDPILKQCIFTKIGDKYHTKEYLVILTFGGEVIMYETFFDKSQMCYRFIKSNNLFNLPISGAPSNSYSYATKIERNLFKIPNFNSHEVVMVSGAMPFMIFKQYNSVPRMFKFTSYPFLYFSPFTTKDCVDGIITIDNRRSCRMVQLDQEFDYSNSLPIKKISMNKTINHISYHEESDVFVISTIRKENFRLHTMEEEEEGGEEKEVVKFNTDLRKPAMNYASSIHLVTADAWRIIDTIDLQENETCTTLKVLTLKSNGTDSERVKVLVGTGILQSEEIATTGSWKLFDIVSVVAGSDKPDEKFKLKHANGETAKGPVLDSCEVDGRFAIIQGQRLLMRMIKSEGTVAPVAFTDTSLYSAKVKSFKNMVMTGDSFHGVNLYGFDADPYRMIPLSQDEHEMNLSECEFIAHNQNLFIVAADENTNLHVLQYDPYDANSLKGHKLLRRSVFRSNSQTTKMIRLNRRSSHFSMVDTLPIRSDIDLGYEILGSNIDGSFYKMSPINEYQYRRLYSLQNYIADKEHHWLGLNPRMNAMGNLQGEMPIIKRPIIEFRLLSKFNGMNEDKKKQFAIRLGKDALVDIYRDLISLQ